MEFLLSWLRLFSPLLIASGGAMVAEASGRTNMALEGQVLTGAFVASLVLNAGGGPVAAVLLALIASASAAFCLSFLTDSLGTDPVIAALASNLAVQALADAGSTLAFGSLGIARFSESAFLGRTWPLAETAVSLFSYALLWILVAQTRPGLRMRAVASDEEAARLAGLDIKASKAFAQTVSGLAGGLAGVLLILSVGAWNQGMTMGKGWLALAACFVGSKRFGRIIMACVVLSGAQELSLVLQGPGRLPAELSHSFPYVLTLAVMMLSRRKDKVRPPL